MVGPNHGGKRKKSFYVNAAKKARNAAGHGRALVENMKGFLITCNNRWEFEVVYNKCISIIGLLTKLELFDEGI